jgi:hypothetical protein
MQQQQQQALTCDVDTSICALGALCWIAVWTRAPAWDIYRTFINAAAAGAVGGCAHGTAAYSNMNSQRVNVEVRYSTWQQLVEDIEFQL